MIVIDYGLQHINGFTEYIINKKTLTHHTSLLLSPIKHKYIPLPIPIALRWIS